MINPNPYDGNFGDSDDFNEEDDAPHFTEDSERTEFLKNVLDDTLSEMHTGDLLSAAKFHGIMEGLLVVGVAFNLLTEEEVQSFIERGEAINDLKSNDILHWKPLLFIPPNKEGRKWAKDTLENIIENLAILGDEKKKVKKEKPDNPESNEK
jgi:hypothetical protein